MEAKEKANSFLNEDSPGLALLEKGQQGLAHMVFSRVGIIVLLLLFQLFLVFAAFYWLNAYLPHFFIFTILFSAFMGLYLLNTDMDPSAKITWLLVILLLPAVGAPLYCYTRSNLGMRILKKRLRYLVESTEDSIPQNEAVLAELREESPGAAALAHYMHRTGCFPVYDHTEVKYYPLGEDKWLDLLQALEQAEHFIFLEYFITDVGPCAGDPGAESERGRGCPRDV